MFACAALVACTNDDIVENDVNKPQTEDLESVPAYITVSIGTSSSSSRATVDGDTDGNSENSSHENGGTEEENKINEIAVIIKTLAADEQTNASNSGVAEIITEFNEDKVGNETVLTVDKAFKVLAGTHKVLTIINPTAEIKTAVTNAKTNGYVAIGDLYDNLVKGKLGKEKEYGLLFTELNNTCSNGIMFLNRDEVTVEAKSTNSETSPAVATIMLERPVAKLMYRGNKSENTYPITIKVTKQEYNVVKVGSTIYALVKDAADRIRAVEATDIKEDNGKVTELSLVKQDGVFKCYTYNNETKDVGTEVMTPVVLKGEPIAIPENQYYLLKDEEGNWIAPECIFTPYTEELGGENGWKVKLTEYALINLTGESYVIRHTANELGTEVNPFGLLTGKNYIADPYFDAKNTAATTYKFADYADWKEGDWSSWNTAAKGWFKNTLKDVADETSGTETTPSYFAPLPSDVTENTNHDATKVGTLLQYCFENGVMSHNQLHGLTTGIVFKGVVTGADLPTMYQYGTEVYTELADIIKAYGSGNKAIADLKSEDGTITTDEATIKAAGIKIYANNECYYYTNQIKHFDNGDNNVAGNMEFAIVRNNIYSLAVTDIKNIGDAAIDPNPGTENESSVGYIKVEAERIPWIVRFNDIEF